MRAKSAAAGDAMPQGNTDVALESIGAPQKNTEEVTVECAGEMYVGVKQNMN